MNALKRVLQDGEGPDGVSSAEVETLVVICGGKFATIVIVYTRWVEAEDDREVRCGQVSASKMEDVADQVMERYCVSAVSRCLLY